METEADIPNQTRCYASVSEVAVVGGTMLLVFVQSLLSLIDLIQIGHKLLLSLKEMAFIPN